MRCTFDSPPEDDHQEVRREARKRVPTGPNPYGQLDWWDYEAPLTDSDENDACYTEYDWEVQELKEDNDES